MQDQRGQYHHHYHHDESQCGKEWKSGAVDLEQLDLLQRAVVCVALKRH